MSEVVEALHEICNAVKALNTGMGVVVSMFLIGIQNLRENLTQNDKAEIMNSLDQQTKDILTKVEESLEKQNEMLREILKRLR